MPRLIPGAAQAGRLSLPDALPTGVTWAPSGISQRSDVYAAAAAATAAIASGVAPSPSLMRGTVPLQRSTSTSSAPAQVRDAMMLQQTLHCGLVVGGIFPAAQLVTYVDWSPAFRLQPAGCSSLQALRCAWGGSER